MQRLFLFGSICLFTTSVLAGTATTVVIVNNANLAARTCRDSKCAPRWCKQPNTLDSPCVDCRENAHCSGSTPYCVNNVCVRCVSHSDCASHTNCDSACVDNTCVETSALNCQTENSTRTGFGTLTHCFVGQRRCVECVDNTPCAGSPRPYCSGSTYSCEKCLSNLYCRSEDNCNALCATTAPAHAQDCYNATNVTTCENSELCYKNDGACFAKCANNTMCGEMFSDKGMCHIQTGKCVGCFADNDCGISSNATCGRNCQYVVSQDQQICAGGETCDTAKVSCRYGYFRDGATFSLGWGCSNANALSAALISIFGLAIAATLL